MCLSMMTSTNGSILHVSGLCARNSPVTGEFPSQRPVTQRFDVLICAWTNDWVNTRDTGDFRRLRAYYDIVCHCNGPDEGGIHNTTYGRHQANSNNYSAWNVTSDDISITISSYGTTYVSLGLCAGKISSTGGFPHEGPIMRSIKKFTNCTLFWNPHT